MRTNVIVGCLLLALLAAGCGRSATVKEISVVPEPVFMVQKEGSYTLHSSLKMSVTGIGQNSPMLKYVLKTLRSAHFRPSMVSAALDSDLELALNDTLNTELGDEGYLLEVRGSGIRLSANTERGLLYGCQTFLQMLPADVTRSAYSAVTLPECTILDHPHFPWRGIAVVDTLASIGKKHLRRLLDVMSLYKLNRLYYDGGEADASGEEWADLRDYAAARGVTLVVADSASRGFETDTVFCRRGFYEGLDRAREGCMVVMCPPDYCDWCRYQAEARYQPKASAGIITLARVYAFDPVPEGTAAASAAAIIGACGRYAVPAGSDARRAEYMLLPRALALSEVLWSPSDVRNWGRFRRKVEVQKERLAARGITYCEGSFTPIFSARRVDETTMNIEVSTEVPNTYIFYTTDGSTPTRQSAVYIGPVNLQRGTHIKLLPVYKDIERDSVYEFVIK